MRSPGDAGPGPRLRSQAWFDNPGNNGMTALYIERYLNWGLTREELQSGKPVIGIAQTGSDLVPCNRHHLQLAERVREGIREGGGLALEFPVHPLQETGSAPRPHSTGTWPTWGWSRSSTAIRWTGSYSRPAATRPPRRASWPRPP